MKTTVVSSVLLTFLLVTNAAAVAGEGTQAKASLEDTKWDVRVIPDEKSVEKGEKEFSDTIIFQKGRVSMAETRKQGFAPTKYSLSNDEGHWKFKTQQLSDEHGKNLWEGEIQGDVIQGKLQWVKSGGSVINYTFEGKKSR